MPSTSSLRENRVPLECRGFSRVFQVGSSNEELWNCEVVWSLATIHAIGTSVWVAAMQVLGRPGLAPLEDSYTLLAIPTAVITSALERPDNNTVDYKWLHNHVNPGH